MINKEREKFNLEEWLSTLDKSLSVLMLVKGKLQDGTPHYAYVKIKPSRYNAFKAAEESGNYNLYDYGEIIEHGEGESPPDKVKKRIEQKYRANHLLEHELVNMMQKAKQEALRKMT